MLIGEIICEDRTRRIEDIKVGAKYGGFKRGDMAQIIINPTRNDIARMLQSLSAKEAGFPALRMLDAPNAIAIWDSNAAPHAAVRTALSGDFYGVRSRFEIWATQGMARVLTPPRYQIGRFTVIVMNQGSLVEPRQMSAGLRQLLGPRIDLQPTAENNDFSVHGYHGTGADIIAFKPKNLSGRGQHLLDIGIHVSENPSLANEYAHLTQAEYQKFLHGMSAGAKTGSPVVYPLLINPGRVLDLTQRSVPDDLKTSFVTAYQSIASPQTVRRYADMLGYDPVIALTHFQLKAGRRALYKLIVGLGYDSIRYNFGADSANYVIFDPKRIRSRFANLDPTKDSSNLMDSQ